ncbi:hypothetical protein T05_629 [Trichinella murrelli]|uniref:Uncharacterized protein n=1 Tax=Trichinella murrelli TaxID=144512 RepID=A0A0V0TZI0_9BILA|nr:hypothetical protein T05_629 [Trichinella murrelli]
MPNSALVGCKKQGIPVRKLTYSPMPFNLKCIVNQSMISRKQANLHQPGRVVKIRRTDTLANNIPVSTAGLDRHFLLVHDVLQLGPYFAHFAHRFHVDKVVGAPAGTVPVHPPLLVDVKQSQVVAFGNLEFFPLRIAVLFSTLGSVEYRRHRQHAHNGQHFFAAAHFASDDEHFGQGRVERQFDHPASEFCQLAGVVQRAQRPQLVHRIEQVVLGRCVHEVEFQQIVHAERFQQQHHVRQVGPLNLGYGIGQQFLFVLAFRVETVTLAGSGAAGSTRTLVRARLADREHLQRVHADARVEHLQLAIAGVDDEQYTVQRERRFGDVGRHDALATVVNGAVEYPRLQVSRQLGIDRQNGQRGRVVQLVQTLGNQGASRFDLLLAGHEDENVARQRGTQVDADRLLDGRLDVVVDHQLAVGHLDRERAAGYVEDGYVAEKVGELGRVHGRRRDDQFQIPTPGQHLFQQAEQHVGVQRSLVGFVHDHDAVVVEIRLAQTFAQQYPVCHVFEHRRRRRGIFETYSVADLFAQRHAHLVGNPSGDRHRRHAPRLRAADHQAPVRVAVFEQILAELGGLAAAGLADHHHNAVFADHVQQPLSDREHRQKFPLLFQAFFLRKFRRATARGPIAGRPGTVVIHVLGESISRLVVVGKILLCSTTNLL